MPEGCGMPRALPRGAGRDSAAGRGGRRIPFAPKFLTGAGLPRAVCAADPPAAGPSRAPRRRPDPPQGPRRRAARLRRAGQGATGVFGGAPFAASRAVTATPRVPRSHLSSLCQPWSPSSKSRNRYRGGSGGTSLSRSTILPGGGEHPPPPLPCGGAVTPHPPNRAGGKAQRGRRRDGSGTEQSPPAARGGCAHQGVRSARRSRLPAAVDGPQLRVPVPGEPSAGGGGLGGARPPAHSPGTSARAPPATADNKEPVQRYASGVRAAAGRRANGRGAY